MYRYTKLKGPDIPEYESTKSTTEYHRVPQSHRVCVFYIFSYIGLYRCYILFVILICDGVHESTGKSPQAGKNGKNGKNVKNTVYPTFVHSYTYILYSL